MSRILSHPLPIFNFEVEFINATEGSSQQGKNVPFCGGAFSEVSGLAATMEPKAIKAGGRNYGEYQRAGRVSFSTVVLKRGVIRNRDMWRWFNAVSTGAYAVRFDVKITLKDLDNKDGVMTWSMKNALLTKFKAADFNSTSNQVPIEELHFVHEELINELVANG